MMRWLDRILAWLAAKRGYMLVCHVVAEPKGWHFPPLKEPTTRVSWSEPPNEYECMVRDMPPTRRDWIYGRWSGPDG